MTLSLQEACKPVGAAFPRISKGHLRILHHTGLYPKMQDLPAAQLTLHACQQSGTDGRAEHQHSHGGHACVRVLPSSLKTNVSEPSPPNGLSHLILHKACS